MKATALVMVINKRENIQPVLERLLEVGVTGATVLESTGMGRNLLFQTSSFALMRLFEPHTSERNHTIFSIIQDRKTLLEAKERICQLLESFQPPGSGILFSVEVSDFVCGNLTEK